MKHAQYFAAKFIGCLALLFLFLGIGYGLSFGNVFLVALVLSAVSYFIGDMMILRKTNNLMATLSDFVLAFVVIYFMVDALTVGGELFTAALLSAVAVAVFEYIFHKYVATSGIYEAEDKTERKLNLSTEASEELFPYDKKEKDR
ncbi:hypothetical protein GCM10010954_27190 [Halobacillus andaensis]|uniref:DUF2512 family protein n=1 Tax=Halobacillus andaensis TaxID=1176239 RepID=A0A917EWH7_HALAA|nr:DUF2512 family protein [Halobacillus andaensis]MBP2005695.1 uncharacterized membrane protein YvlD (DUF360 family) [Halobacillus andaensis]GGF26707.1 hypothetical protein GCM10010954_27190 [Halobacillus andaensis]